LVVIEVGVVVVVIVVVLVVDVGVVVVGVVVVAVVAFVIICWLLPLLLFWGCSCSCCCCCCVVRAVYKLDINPSSDIDLQIFFPFHELPFHFIDCVL